MNLTDKDIIKYQSLVKKRFGFDVPKEEARVGALSLVRLVKLCIDRKDDCKNE